MISKIFSKHILAGLRKHGLSLSETCRITGLSQADLKLVREERLAFKHSHLRRIEQETRLSAGQLAAKRLTSKVDKPFKDLMDAWATMLEFDTPKTKRVAHRAS